MSEMLARPRAETAAGAPSEQRGANAPKVDSSMEVEEGSGAAGSKTEAEMKKAAAAARGRKGGKQRIDSDQATKTKLLLQNTQLLRQLVSAVMACWLLPSSSDLVAAGLETGAAYAGMVEAAGGGHNHGAPHTHIATAVLKELSESEKVEEEDKTAIVQVVAEITAKGPHRAAEIIPYFTVKQAYKEAGQKLAIIKM